MGSTLKGSCLCGAVAVEAARDQTNVTACRCGQCRRWSGNFWASVNVPHEGLRITKGEKAVGWFRSSDYARRGFCKECGSALFWHGDKLDDHKHRIAIGAGSLAAPTGLHMAEHIFVADKGDYYEITDGLPQKARY